MSLATRCTHCGTIFKVVQDQLKVSDGWVRCGRCSEIFHALPGLFDLDKDPPPPRPPHAPSPPAPPPSPDPLMEQGLLDEATVELDYDTQTPDAWAKTQPSGIPRPTFDETALALDPAPIEAATDFELDTAIAVDDNTPLEDVIAAVAPTAPRAPAPLPYPEDVPSTDEEDALDSRYLMPTARERKAPRRREEGPEFADAQFPSDAFLDAQEDWASDFGLSALEADAPTPTPAPAPTPLLAAKAPATPPGTSMRVTQDMATTQPSRLGDDDAPVLALTPPPGKQRKGRREQKPEFLKRAQRQAFWRHPAMRAVLSLMALGLLLGLGLQMAHQFRDLIAAYHPASRPLLAQWCDIAGCQIAPPLRLQDLQVENIELVRTSSEGPDSYRLAVVVHNKGTIDLAWPHIDLTLTDENGAVIARRAFSPQDARWMDTPDPKLSKLTFAAIPPLAAPSQRSTTLQWRLLAPDIKPAGYTAELFYP